MITLKCWGFLLIYQPHTVETKPKKKNILHNILYSSLYFPYKTLPFHSDWPLAGEYRRRCVHGGARGPRLPGPRGPGRGHRHPGGETEGLPQHLHGQTAGRPKDCPPGGKPVALLQLAHRSQAYTTFQKHILTLSFSPCSCTFKPTRPYTRVSSAFSHTVNVCFLRVCCRLTFLSKKQDKTERLWFLLSDRCLPISRDWTLFTGQHTVHYTTTRPPRLPDTFCCIMSKSSNSPFQIYQLKAHCSCPVWFI